MPIIKSAKKKIRSDKRKHGRNLTCKTALKQAVKTARKSPSLEHTRLAQKALDKAVTAHLIHKNKAARLKSHLAKQTKTA